MKTAVYPGTFDPITYGHIDVIKKSLKIFDRIVVATTDNTDKNYFFSIEERLMIINQSLFKDLKLSKKKIKVISFDNLTIELCKKYSASAIIRGLRAVSDFEYEVQLSNLNRAMNPGIESIFLSPDEKYSFISSSIIKDIARHNGKLKMFVDDYVEKKLREKVN